MEKPDHKKEITAPIIHPTLAVYLSGNFNDQPVNSFQTNSSSDEPTTSGCVYLKKLNKNKLQSSSVIGGRLHFIIGNIFMDVRLTISQN